jgi:hypothetical protein
MQRGASAMLENFILPLFPETLRNEIRGNPVKFFAAQFRTGSFQQAARFLKSEK